MRTVNHKPACTTCTTGSTTILCFGERPEFPKDRELPSAASCLVAVDHHHSISDKGDENRVADLRPQSNSVLDCDMLTVVESDARAAE